MGDTDEVKSLLEGGADVNEQSDVSTIFGTTLLHELPNPTLLMEDIYTLTFTH